MRIPHVNRQKKRMHQYSSRHVGLKLLVGAALGILIFAGLSRANAADLPSFNQVKQDWRTSDAWLLDRNGRELQRVRLDHTVRRFTWTQVNDISPALKDALLASEDQRFFEHDGVDWKGVMGAAITNAGSVGGVGGNSGKGGMRGASTLTMQLVGLLDTDFKRGEGGRTFTQKVGQARAALALEKQWKKAEILEAYLNLVTYRGELQGVAAMSHGLFGKAPHGLDRRESAIAAALLRGPNADARRVADRACWLLNFQAGERSTAKPVSADMCDGLGAEVKQVLARGYEAFPKQDAAPHAARRVFAQMNAARGARITSTLDAAVQAAARNALHARLSELNGRNVEDGAVIVLDNVSGEVLAYVGSSGDLSQAAAVDGVVALRQAGSTLKPFLYGLAIEEGRLTAASLLDDSPVQLKTDTGLYIPRNYAKAYRGAVSVRASLAGSLNVPAVRTLVMVGTDRFAERLRAVGMDSVREAGDYYGFSLALGSADVTLLTLTNAYRTLANGGVWSETLLARATVIQPLLLAPKAGASAAVAAAPAPATAPRRAMSAAASYIVADMLSDRAARAVAFGLDNPLHTPFWSAVKTGTSKDMRDNWAVGFTSRYTVGVWVGNASGSPMHDVSGISGAAPVWRDVMMHLHRRGAVPSIAPALPAGVIVQEVRYEPALEPPRREAFVAGSERAVVQSVAFAGKGSDAANVQTRIASPVPGSIIALDPDIPPKNQRMQFAATAYGAARWELDGKVLGAANRPVSWFPLPGVHVLKLVSGKGEVLDEARFEVRGASIRTAAR